MLITLAFTAGVSLGAGVAIGQLWGRKLEQKAIAKTLSEFAQVDQEARSLVHRCYSRLADGIRAELDKLLKR